MQSYGCAPCPCCQSERRKDQNALTLTENHGQNLLSCKKTGCERINLLKACGIQPGGYEADFEAVKRAEQALEQQSKLALDNANKIWLKS